MLAFIQFSLFSISLYCMYDRGSRFPIYRHFVRAAWMRGNNIMSSIMACLTHIPHQQSRPPRNREPEYCSSLSWAVSISAFTLYSIIFGRNFYCTITYFGKKTMHKTITVRSYYCTGTCTWLSGCARRLRLVRRHHAPSCVFFDAPPYKLTNGVHLKSLSMCSCMFFFVFEMTMISFFRSC